MTKNHHTLTRLYIAPTQPWQQGDVLNLPTDAHHHIRNVLRHTVGDGVRVFDGIHGEWLAHITDLSKKNGTITLTEQIRPQTVPTGTPLHIAVAPLKKTACDIAIEKSVELGVQSVTLIQTERTNATAPKSDKVHARIIGASQQCERLNLPLYNGVQPLNDWLNAQTAPILYCAESGTADPMPKTLTTLKNTENGIIMLVGAEGGFTPTELTQLANHPTAHAVSLGPRILRAETAVVASLSIAMALVGDWDTRPPR